MLMRRLCWLNGRTRRTQQAVLGHVPVAARSWAASSLNVGNVAPVEMSLAELLRQSLFEKGNFMRVNSALLEKQLFFRGMANRQLELLAENSMPAEFNAGDPILTQGDSASHFHLILEGEVDLISRGLDDETVRIQSIGKGDLLGWSWLFPPYYWHFDARAITPVKTLSFLGTRL